MRLFTLTCVISTLGLIGCSEKAPAPSTTLAEPTVSLPVTPVTEAVKRGVRPIALTLEDRKNALPRDYPEFLRAGMTDERLAQDLELQAWAFDYSGGPLRCWLEVAEVGQKTMSIRHPTEGYGDWVCPAEAGHLVFSVGRGASERMKVLMQKQGKDAFPESMTFNLKLRSNPVGKSGSFGTSTGDSPLWYRWPGADKKLTVKADEIEAYKLEEAFTIISIECTEQEPAKKGSPRKATLALKGSFGPDLK
jgi:hypothetical protein